MLESTIDRCGGLASTAELHRAGIRRSDIEDAIAEGRIIRVRQGWYARAGIDRDLLAAARVGGRATCATALVGLGAWVRADADIHLAVRRNACQLRSPSDSRRRLSDADPVRVHWDDTGAGTSRLRVDPVHALADLSLCADPDAVVAAADSLLLRSPVLRRTWQSRVSACPLALRQLLESADGICESGTETRFWRRMRRKLLLRRQVHIRGVGRIDFLIGDRLVVEIDGAAYHTDPVAFERDRRRDALLSALGYRVLRFSYRQVMDEWPSVEAAVLAAVARLDHV